MIGTILKICTKSDLVVYMSGCDISRAQVVKQNLDFHRVAVKDLVNCPTLDEVR